MHVFLMLKSLTSVGGECWYGNELLGNSFESRHGVVMVEIRSFERNGVLDAVGRNKTDADTQLVT